MGFKNTSDIKIPEQRVKVFAYVHAADSVRWRSLRWSWSAMNFLLFSIDFVSRRDVNRGTRRGHRAVVGVASMFSVIFDCIALSSIVVSHRVCWTLSRIRRGWQRSTWNVPRFVTVKVHLRRLKSVPWKPYCSWLIFWYSSRFPNILSRFCVCKRHRFSFERMLNPGHNNLDQIDWNNVRLWIIQENKQSMASCCFFPPILIKITKNYWFRCEIPNELIEL